MDVVRLVVTRRTDDKWGDASRGTSPTDTQGLSVELCQNKKTDTLPSGRWQDNQTPTIHLSLSVEVVRSLQGLSIRY